jgi:hypothetical protein
VIDRQEVMDFSKEFGLASQVIEKDYVLGWLLAGISQHAVLGSEWVFKGGTCLKKCYFETYRFSEDLDFTIKSQEHLDEVYLKAAFQEIASWVYDATGIQIPQDTIRFDVYTNPRGKTSVQGKIGYRGPMMRDGDLPLQSRAWYLSNMNLRGPSLKLNGKTCLPINCRHCHRLTSFGRNCLRCSSGCLAQRKKPLCLRC